MFMMHLTSLSPVSTASIPLAATSRQWLPHGPKKIAAEYQEVLEFLQRNVASMVNLWLIYG